MINDRINTTDNVRVELNREYDEIEAIRNVLRNKIRASVKVPTTETFTEDFLQMMSMNVNIIISKELLMDAKYIFPEGEVYAIIGEEIFNKLEKRGE